MRTCPHWFRPSPALNSEWFDPCVNLGSEALPRDAEVQSGRCSDADDVGGEEVHAVAVEVRFDGHARRQGLYAGAIRESTTGSIRPRPPPAPSSWNTTTRSRLGTTSRTWPPVPSAAYAGAPSDVVTHHW